MDDIKKAVEKAKTIGGNLGVDALRTNRKPGMPQSFQPATQTSTLTIDPGRLEKSRIVAHQVENSASMSFDLLRTRVIQHMRTRDLKTLVITSPTPSCGKSVTAINLALSMARQADIHTVLVDLDLRKPQIANYLGIRPAADVLQAFGKQCDVSDALYAIDIAGPRLRILPAAGPTRRPAETVASPDMKALIDRLAGLHGDTLVVVDMPPVLVFDDVISFLPYADAVLLVIAAGESTDRDVEEALRLIPKDKLAGVVLTKSEEKADSGYYKYY
jgi:protein-tyrosine kinase